VNLVTPTAGAKHGLLFNEPTSGHYDITDNDITDNDITDNDITYDDFTYIDNQA
jgi:hypothetical protein